jgi:hypothetical protein
MFLPMTWMLWKSQQLLTAKPKKTSFLCGALLGISCWINPSLQVLGIAVPVFWKLNGFLPGREGLKRLGIFVAGFILVIAPWTVRNYIRLGAFVPLRSAFAFNVWRGNHIGATGTVRTREFINVDKALPPDYDAYVKAHITPDEIQRDRFYGAEVKRFISERPREYLSLTLHRLSYYWWRDPTNQLTFSPWYFLPWVFLLFFSGWGVYLVRREWRRWSVWALQILGFTTLYCLTIVTPRYRMSMYPALFLLAGVALVKVLKRFFPRLFTENSPVSIS